MLFEGLPQSGAGEWAVHLAALQVSQWELPVEMAADGPHGIVLVLIINMYKCQVHEVMHNFPNKEIKTCDGNLLYGESWLFGVPQVA